VSERFFRALARQAASGYPARDLTARHFGFGKLTGDPVFRHILENALIPPGARLLDLGCGQGVLAALLQAAKGRHAARDWPAAWPAPPHPRRIRGIDLRRKDIERARAAGVEASEWICGDIRTTEFGRADAVVILDVLHYIDYAAQAQVLARARDSLADGGVLLLRVADESPTLRFRITLAIDRAMMRLRGHRLARFYCKPVATWRQELAALGFAVEAVPMSAGTPFANTLLISRLMPHASRLIT
jgi:SAM-dependent methyltransferase